MIRESAKRMGDLMYDLLAFSTIGRTETQNTLVSLGQLVQEVLGEGEREMEGRSIAWKVRPLPTLYGDRAMLRTGSPCAMSCPMRFAWNSAG